MCVIVYQPAGERLEKSDAIKLWNTNPDGGGMAYIEGEKVHVFKAMKFSHWWSAYRRALKRNPSSPFLLHMRIATHGEVELSNVHPFKVDAHTVMAHNGVIWDCTPAKHDSRSDTRVFVEDALPSLPKGWLDDPYLFLMVEAFVDGRLMFLTTDPALQDSVYLLGRWETHKGLRLSNTYGLTSTKPTMGTLPAVRSYSDWEWGTAAVDDLKKDEDSGWIYAPDDEDEYQAWLEGVMEKHGVK